MELRKRALVELEMERLNRNLVADFDENKEIMQPKFKLHASD